MALSNKDLLALIGEIDGITLRTVQTARQTTATAVFIDIGGREIEVIRDGHDMIDHRITRCGLAELLGGGE